MNQRTNLGDQAQAYSIGYGKGLEEGRKQGIAMERSRIGKVEWSKLKRIILSRSIIGSVIGCGIILSLAVGLSNIK
jgi:hypothetical protein